jgi:hypothetical protein
LVKVTLNEWHMFLATQVGNMRQLEAMRRGCRNRLAINTPGEWNVHVAGALGEMALAKALGTFWPASVNAAKTECDVWPDWQCVAGHNRITT